MSQTYWDSRRSEPPRLAESLALLVAPMRPVTVHIVPEEPALVPDVSGVELDESGLDFLTEYRAGLPVVVPEPNPEPIEVPDPVPANVVIQDDEPEQVETRDVTSVLESQHTEDLEGNTEGKVASVEDETVGKEDDPRVIYVRDYGPAAVAAPEGQAAPQPTGPAGTLPEGGYAPGVAAASPVQEPARVLPPLSPIALPVSFSSEGSSVAVSPSVPGIQGPVILPPALSNPGAQASVQAENATVYAKTAKIAGLENFDPTRYLDFDDRVEETGEETESDESSEKARTRRVLADFGAGKRITQTENPAQAMQVLRELTVFRD